MRKWAWIWVATAVVFTLSPNDASHVAVWAAIICSTIYGVAAEIIDAINGGK